MCGICGIVSFDDQKVYKNELLRMRESLVHRGPDDSGLFIEDRAFVDCVLDNLPSPSTGEDGLAALRMVMAALESIKTGKPVAL